MDIKYNMDDTTYIHLGDWCYSCWAPFAESKADYARDRIVTYLQSLSVEDAERAMEDGWTKVYDLSTQEG